AAIPSQSTATAATSTRSAPHSGERHDQPDAAAATAAARPGPRRGVRPPRPRRAGRPGEGTPPRAAPQGSTADHRNPHTAPADVPAARCQGHGGRAHHQQREETTPNVNLTQRLNQKRRAIYTPPSKRGWSLVKSTCPACGKRCYATRAD